MVTRTMENGIKGLSGLLLLILAAQGAAAERKLRGSDKPCVTAGSLLNSTASLSKFANALDIFGILDLLEDPRFKATIFAPDDKAWAQLPQQLGLPNEDALLADPRLGALLLYHILPFKAKVKKGLDKPRNVPTLLGQMVTLAPRPKDGSPPTAGDVAQPRLSNFTQVKGHAADNVVDILELRKACKAFIDVVDGVLLPEFDPKVLASTHSIIQEWKATLAVLEERRFSGSHGGLLDGQAGVSGVHAATAHLNKHHKPTTKRIKLTLSAKILALLGIHKGHHNGHGKDFKHGKDSRKVLAAQGPSPIKARQQPWRMLDKLKPGMLLRALHGHMSSLVQASRRGPGRPHAPSPHTHHAPSPNHTHHAPHGPAPHHTPHAGKPHAHASAAAFTTTAASNVSSGAETNKTLAPASSETPILSEDAPGDLMWGIGHQGLDDEDAEHLFDLRHLDAGEVIDAVDLQAPRPEDAVSADDVALLELLGEAPSHQLQLLSTPEAHQS